MSCQHLTTGRDKAGRKPALSRNPETLRFPTPDPLTRTGDILNDQQEPQALLPPNADGAPLAAARDRRRISIQITFQYRCFIAHLLTRAKRPNNNPALVSPVPLTTH